jgi:hypothetical protein
MPRDKVLTRTHPQEILLGNAFETWHFVNKSLKLGYHQETTRLQSKRSALSTYPHVKLPNTYLITYLHTLTHKHKALAHISLW